MTRSRRLVCYDGSGIAAAKLAFVLTLLGHEDVAVYDGGWSEWGNRLDLLPVERWRLSEGPLALRRPSARGHEVTQRALLEALVQGGGGFDRVDLLGRLVGPDRDDRGNRGENPRLVAVRAQDDCPSVSTARRSSPAGSARTARSCEPRTTGR